jgi:glutamate 5-kinase
VNENDTVATEEISFCDNDRLAALVAVMVNADLLILLSDVDGIYTRAPQRGGVLISEMLDPMAAEATRSGSGHGKGGMASKLEAAGLATAAGIPTVVAGAAKRDVLAAILAGDPVGTWIPARAGRERARRAWLAFVAAPRGRIMVDAGAARAVRDARRSLLAAGVVTVQGAFEAGDIVEVVDAEGRSFARGVTGYASDELAKVAGRSRRDLVGSKDGTYDKEVIHRDELVVTVDSWKA